MFKRKNPKDIEINPAHEGLFTKQAQRAGMGVQEFASHVMANKRDYDTATRKRATFAKNAKSFKH
jgi:hypothetical protein